MWSLWMIVKKSHLWKSKAMQKVTMATLVIWNGSWQRANEALSGTQQQSWNILCWPKSLSGFFITSYEKTQTFGLPNTYPIMSRQYAESWTHNLDELNIFVNLKKLLRVKRESHSVVSNSLRCHGLYTPWNSPGQNIGVGSCSLLRGILPTQESTPGLPHCRWTLPAEPQGKPKNTGVGSLFLLQGIFPTQESNRGLLHCRWIIYQLSYKEVPKKFML